ncbi:AAA family ATPase [Tenacibaculum finnmarkense]|uniref:ATP-dependent DNA helicase n=1 Tax=Tenacibaculum finnmarkense TaxID=2781243 RepID=UPI001EFBD0C4|nr:AAA family ATPase [Tenacibaculum finnmarkense]MCG8762473.1 AAA family ATPase [Tenacibaculum finnmarkense]MCG8787775.1 AAA family ATPase [Tenacibaculum finnmarkense]
MKETINDLKIDKENIKFNQAIEFIQKTNNFLYLTGKAGTGKTTFLKNIKNVTEKNTVILAPTGVAAINAGGVTIYSFFQIPFGPFLPNDLRLRTNSSNTESKETIYTTFKYSKDKVTVIENLELLIIDEISMVRCDLLDVIDKILRAFRKTYHLPFGGVQVILIGDTFQLPPITNSDEWNILSQFYKTPFFFSSKIIEQKKPLYIEFKKIYRQNEQEFIDLLNRVRVNKVNSNDFSILNSKYNPTFSSNGNNYIILATHNRIVNQTNLTKLNQLETEIFTFDANVNKIFPDKMMPTNRCLKLKVGAQIMFIKNDIGEVKRYYNGKIGKIKELYENKIVVVYLNKKNEEKTITVEKVQWENIKYIYNKNKIEEKIIGTFEQYPIRLAWAITVHKSQGLTFDKVFADLAGSFAAGQVYVALSRCTSFNGLVLKTQLHPNAIKTDLRVLEFAKNETPDTLITKHLSTGKADFNYKKARKHFNYGEFTKSFTFFKKALKFRNDIETDTFQKFVEIQGKKLFNYKSKLLISNKKIEEQHSSIDILIEEKTSYQNKLKDSQTKAEKYLKENNSSKLEVFSYKSKLIISDKKLIQLEEKINFKTQEIEEQNYTINILTKKITNFENNVVILNKELNEAKQDIFETKIKFNFIQDKLKDSQAKAEKYSRENELNKLEIIRLKNLKWYDKLFIGK